MELPGPRRASAFMNLLPVLTAVSAIILLGKPVRLFHIFGGGIALASVVVAQTIRQPLGRRTLANRSLS